MSEVLVLNPKPHDYEVGFPESPPPMNPTDGELLFPPGMTLADYVLQQFKTKTSAEIFMEKGSKLKLTGEMKKTQKILSSYFSNTPDHLMYLRRKLIIYIADLRK